MHPAAFALVVAVALLASCAQTVAGFGFALIAVPFLVVALDVRDAVVVVSLLALLNSALVARSAWEHVPLRTVAVMLAGTFAGMPVGLLVLLLAPEDALRIAVGISSISMAAAIAAGARYGGSDRSGEALAGAVAGVLGTSTGMNGPPVVLYLQERGYPRDEFRGALSAFFVVSGVVSLAAYAGAGVISGFALALAAAGIPAVLGGNAAGSALVGRVSPTVFRRLVFGLLVVSSLAAMAGAAVRLAG